MPNMLLAERFEAGHCCCPARMRGDRAIGAHQFHQHAHRRRLVTKRHVEPDREVRRLLQSGVRGQLRDPALERPRELLRLIIGQIDARLNALPVPNARQQVLVVGSRSDQQQAEPVRLLLLCCTMIGLREQVENGLEGALLKLVRLVNH